MRTLVAAVMGALLFADTAAGTAPVDYLRDIKPLLMERCAICHGALKQKANLRLDASPLWRKGGESGAVIVPGKPEESLLLDAVLGANGVTRMPLEGEPLKAEQIALLRRWIADGAAAPDEAIPEDPLAHWAFQPPQRPAPPAVARADWGSNAIDRFIAARHEERGLTPQSPAPKHVLLRRIYLDLVGVPPTREELHEFLADDSPRAYENVVDRLLASPQYGERWGRHWMDVWRYSDWDGYRQEIRNSQRHIWRWRDWIVESLNADKPYDQMVLEMLAGDEIAPDDPQTLRATGFLARNWFKFNRNVWLDNTVEHTGKAFLGVTLNCARCHDHMYDPFTQQEYYEFRAIFEPYDVRTDRVPGEADLMKDGLPRVYDAKADTPTYLFVRGDEKDPLKENPLSPGVPAALGGELTISAVELPPPGYYPGLRSFIQQEELAAAEHQIEQARAETQTIAGEIAKLRGQLAAIAPQGENAASAETTTTAASTNSAEPTASPDAAKPADDKALANQLAEKEAAAVLTLKKLAHAEASLAAVKARIAADQARYATPPAANHEELARAAALAEAQANLLKAEMTVASEEQKLIAARNAVVEGDDKTKQAVTAAEKKNADALKAVEAARKALEQPGATYTSFGSVYPQQSTGRRLALARWITRRDNPLTARVAVNHLWMRHFGSPLVPTTFDFGVNGKPPSHPQLLDWLAVELMESGWSMKHIHRLMVTSSTYRMDSAGAALEANAKLDPDNRFLWRMNARRMEAEVVRDSVLAVGGQLDPSMGGPDLDENLSQTNPRRSIYFRHAAEKRMLFASLFDSASVTECYRRDESITPQQALALANSPLALSQARLLARKLSDKVGQENASDGAFITAAFEQVLGRLPTDAEVATCTRFLAEQPARLQAAGLVSFTAGEAAAVEPSSDPRMRARENLAHVLLNHHEFITIR